MTKDHTSKTSAQAKAAPKGASKPERIAKVLARAGVASRREVERMIMQGRVSIDGKVLDTPATLVTSTKGITVEGQAVGEREHTRVWRLYKTGDCVTTSHDPGGRKTIYNLLPEDLPRVITVGRLDLTTEGLLLLTNDGELARWMELPKTGWKRTYRVRVYGRVKESDLDGLKKGVTVEGVKYGPIEASLERSQGANAWLKISIREGKNREIRRVMEHLGLRVNRLIRTSYGPYELGNMEEGDVVEVPATGIATSLPKEMRGNFNLPPKEVDVESPRKGHAKAKPKKPFRGSGGPRPSGKPKPKPKTGPKSHAGKAKGRRK